MTDKPTFAKFFEDWKHEMTTFDQALVVVDRQADPPMRLVSRLGPDHAALEHRLLELEATSPFPRDSMPFRRSALSLYIDDVLPEPLPWKIHDHSPAFREATRDPTQNRAARRKARYRAKGKGRVT